MHSGIGLLWTLWFSQGKDPGSPTHPVKDMPAHQEVRLSQAVHTVRQTTGQVWSSTTSFLTATTLIYAIGAGITAAAGTRLALQSFLIQCFSFFSFQLGHIARAPHCYVLSLPQAYAHWVICAPAAFLGCGSRFSGSLSGIEPLFPLPVETMVGLYPTIESW